MNGSMSIAWRPSPTPRSLLDLAKPTLRFATLPTARTTYEEEAAFEVMRAAGRISFDEEVALRKGGKGVPMTSPFYTARYLMAAAYLGGRDVGEEGRLLLWGPSLARGQLLRQEAAQLLHGALRNNAQRGEVIRGWASAAGTPGLALAALEALAANIEDRERNRLPEVMDAPGISEAAFHVALRLAGDDALLALNLCQCFARIAAVTFAEGTLIRWRFAWLRGKGKSARAIPGTSGRYKAIMAILTSYIFEEVEGAVRGQKSKTYRLRVSIERGPVSLEEATLKLGIRARKARQE
jgi:hypothetical protein